MIWRDNVERHLIKGKTVEEKFASLETLFQQFKRKMIVKTVGIIPPVPFWDSIRLIGAGGIISSIFIPFECLLTKAFIYFHPFPGRAFEISLSIIRQESMHTEKTMVSRAWSSYDLDMPVEAGSLFQLSIAETQGLVGVDIGFSVMPHRRYYEEQIIQIANESPLPEDE